MILRDLSVGAQFTQSNTWAKCLCEFRVAGAPEGRDEGRIPVEIVSLCWMHFGQSPWVSRFNPETPVLIDVLSQALADTFAETLGG